MTTNRPFLTQQATLHTSPPGHDPPVQVRRGDFILTHGGDIYAQLIRIGQSLRIRGDDRQYTTWNHAALVTGNRGEIVEAVSQGVRRGNISQYQPKYYVLVQTSASEEDRAQVVAFAESCVGARYGWLLAASIGLTHLTGGKFDFGVDGQWICSGLVAQAEERTGAIFDRDPSHIAPADLAKYYKVMGWTTNS